MRRTRKTPRSLVTLVLAIALAVACSGSSSRNRGRNGQGGETPGVGGATSGAGGATSGVGATPGAGGSAGATAGTSAAGEGGASATGGEPQGGSGDEGGEGGGVCGTPTDPRNCGRCGHDCTALPYVSPSGIACQNGQCTYGPGACLSGFAHCSTDPADADDGCRDDLTRVRTCGSCSTSCTGATPYCASPASQTPFCINVCPSGLEHCGTQCVDLASNASHCSACNTGCSDGNSAGICVGGQCRGAGCFPGYADCFSEVYGCETFLSTYDHCARCGDSCGAAHATGTCNAGTCVRECDAGYGNCNTANPDCETQLNTAEHCGVCGSECSGADDLCEDGTCVPSCSSGATPCGTACVDVNENPLHCGACNEACESYQACENGRCTPRYLGTGVSERSEYSVNSISMGADGSFVVMSGLYATADLDPGPGTDIRTSRGSEDTAISKFNADGSYAYSRVFGGTQPDTPGWVELGPDGSMLATFDYQGSIDLDPGSAISTRSTLGTEEQAVVKLSADGSFVWGRVFTVATAKSMSMRGPLAIDGSGNTYVFGAFTGTVDLDPGLSTFMQSSASPSTAYLVKLNPTGDFVWAMVFTECQPFVLDLAFAASGALFAVGSYSESGDLDPGPGTLAATAMGGSDSFWLELDAQTGTVRGGEAFSMAVTDGLAAIAFDPNGTSYLSGSYSVDFPTTTFLHTLNGARERNPFKTYEEVAGLAIASAPGGGVVGAGMGSRGTGPLSQGVFLTKLDRAGDAVWSIDLPSRDSGPHGIVANAQGFVVIGYLSEYPIDFDPGPGTEQRAVPGVFITRYAF